MEKPLEILDLPEDVRRLVGECELTGKRTVFARSGRPVAVLVSHDEYVALQETLAIATNATLRDAIAAAEKQAERGALLIIDDLLEA